MRIFFSLFRPLYEADNGGQGAGNGGQQQQDDQGAADRQQLQGLLARHNNDAMAVVATLLSENHSLRDERRQLRGQIPAQGAVVLSGEQATAWQAYQQLGAIADVQTALTERETTQKELATLRQDLLLRDVASLAKFDLDVLKTIGGNLSYVIKDATENGKAVKQVLVKDGETETPIEKYAEAKWGKFLPSLKTETPARPAIGTPQTPRPQPPLQQQPQPPRKSTVRF
jgi:hypothetical protein